MYVKNNHITYFDSFGIEHIPKEIKRFIRNKNNKTNFFRIHAYDSIMCGHSESDLLILCLKVRAWLNIQISFRLMVLKEMMIQF